MPFSSDRSAATLISDSPRWQYHLWLVCICAGMLVFFAQVTTLYPVLPVYLTQRWGENAPVGWVVGSLAAGLLCFRTWIGMLIDRWGRKPVLIAGLLIMIGILPLYGWSPSPTWLMGVRVLHGISQAAFATASQTMLADLVPPQHRAALMGYLAMSNTIGFSLGPLLGSYAFARGGFTAVLSVILGLTVLGLGISLPLPWLLSSGHSPQAQTNQAQTDSAPGFPWKYILSFPVRDATFVFFVGSFLHGSVITFLPLFVSNSALFYSLNAFIAILVRFGLGRWGNRVPQRWIISGSLFCSGGALIGLSLLPQHLALWSVLYGLGFGSLFPVLSAIVSLAAPADVRGRVYSFFLAGFDSGMTLGGAGVQPLMGILPLGSLFTLLGGLGCGVSVVAFRRFSHR